MALDVQLGAMSRPWSMVPWEDGLAGIAAAGFRHYGFLGQGASTRITADTPPAEVDAAIEAVRRHGLTTSLLFSSTPMDVPEEDAVARVRGLVDNAVRAGVSLLLDMGAQPQQYDRYVSVMRAAAPYAAERGVHIAVKPHGGIVTTGDDCLRVLEAVGHPGFRLCFDPGNLLYYAGQRPEAELPRLAQYVVGMCVKDETGGSGPQRSVDVTPGDGDVDFPAVFRILQDAGFAGKPAIVETLAGKTADEVNAQAVRAHAYLTQVLASV